MTDQCALLKSQASQAFEGALSSQLSVESLYVLLQSLQHGDTVPETDRWALADQMISKINAEGSLVIKRESIEELIGRDFDLQELQVNLITISGHLDEDDDEFKLTISSASATQMPRFSLDPLVSFEMRSEERRAVSGRLGVR